jgi:hypothetical protein
MKAELVSCIKSESHTPKGRSLHCTTTQINPAFICLETVTQSFLSPNPFAGMYRGASILIGSDSWIVYYPSTSEHVLGYGCAQCREQAIREARKSIDSYLANFSTGNEALHLL